MVMGAGRSGTGVWEKAAGELRTGLLFGLLFGLLALPGTSDGAGVRTTGAPAGERTGERAGERLGEPVPFALEREVPGGRYTTPPLLPLPADPNGRRALDVSNICSGFLLDTRPHPGECGRGTSVMEESEPLFITANHCEPPGGVHTLVGPGGQSTVSGFARSTCGDILAARLPQREVKRLGVETLPLAAEFPQPGARVYLLGYINRPVRVACTVLGVTAAVGASAETARVYRHVQCDPPYSALNGLSGGPVVNEAGAVVGFNSNQLIMQDDLNNRMGVLPLTAAHRTCEGGFFLAPRGVQRYRTLVKDFGKIVPGELTMNFAENGCALAASRSFRPLLRE